MKHVHAEVIKAWADDTTLVVECRSGEGAAWGPLKDVGVAFWHPDYQYRIKPQPKAIRWTCVYKSGDAGGPFESKEKALQCCVSTPIYLLEVRDDGTAHLHKVEK